MKIKFAWLAVVAFAFFVSASAQSVVITSKKTLYRRAKPLSDYKKTFTVNYPIVKAATPALSRKIGQTISYSKVMQLNVQEDIRDMQWLEEADYEVNYNARGILVITLSISGSGAYPDQAFKTVAVDLKTGDRITAAQAFKDTAWLIEEIEEKQQREIEQSIKELREDPEEKDTDPSDLFKEEKFTAKDLEEFSISNSGVTFIYKYGFPHVIKALEPEGRYTFTWKELGCFIKPGGPLAKFQGNTFTVCSREKYAS